MYATECKRLLFARTVAEIGERLREYTSVAAPGDDRTPIQKHLDPAYSSCGRRSALSKLTGIPADKIKLQSALVTDYLVPCGARRKRHCDSSMSSPTLRYWDWPSVIRRKNNDDGMMQPSSWARKSFGQA